MRSPLGLRRREHPLTALEELAGELAHVQPGVGAEDRAGAVGFVHGPHGYRDASRWATTPAMQFIGAFAPWTVPPAGASPRTPSGALHVGSARTACAAAMSAWSAGGRFALRLEVLDAVRAPPGATAAMLDDLHRLGLDCDEGPDVGGPSTPYAQRERTALYAATLSWLHDRGLAYPCACSRSDVELAAHAPHHAEPV